MDHLTHSHHTIICKIRKMSPANQSLLPSGTTVTCISNMCLCIFTLYGAIQMHHQSLIYDDDDDDDDVIIIIIIIM